jgi:hypothetical protein
MSDELVTQPSARPTRKVFAALIATVIFAICMVILTRLSPEFAGFLDTEALSFAIEALVFAVPGLIATLSAYLTRDRKPDVHQVSTSKETIP